MSGRFFDPERGGWRLLGVLGDLLLLSMLWVLCAAPLVTAGAATAALYDAAVRRFHRREQDELPRFFAVLRRELKASLLPTLLCGSILAGLLALLRRLAAPAGPVAGSAAAVLLLFSLGLCALVFPLLSRFSASPGKLMVNALRLALGHLPRTAALAAGSAAGLWLTLRFALLPLFLLPALWALYASVLLEPVFRTYEA